MKSREFLQVEIWSKKTTRRIYVLFGMAFLVLGTILLTIRLWQEVNGRWLTASERKAGTTALKEVDSLQSFTDMNDAQFDTGEKQAAGDVQLSKQVAWTSRDKVVAASLDMYLSLTKNGRNTYKFLKEKTDSRGDESGKTARMLFSNELHRALE